MLALGWLLMSRPLLLYVDPVDYERAQVLEACDARGVVRACRSPCLACLPCVLHSKRKHPHLKAVHEVWSHALAKRMCERPEASEADLQRVQAAVAPAAGEEREWCRAALGRRARVAGVLCGSDGGLGTAERLQDALAAGRSNGVVPARRDKFLMHEVLRAAGLRAAAQVCECSLAVSC
jgi:hypothetical protein